MVNDQPHPDEGHNKDVSVRPLVRLGMLVSSPETPNIYSLTETALKLCRDYWARSDRNDPDLPKLSLR
jgi:hypothetical protein